MPIADFSAKRQKINWYVANNFEVSGSNLYPNEESNWYRSTASYFQGSYCQLAVEINCAGIYAVLVPCLD